MNRSRHKRLGFVGGIAEHIPWSPAPISLSWAMIYSACNFRKTAGRVDCVVLVLANGSFLLRSRFRRTTERTSVLQRGVV